MKIRRVVNHARLLEFARKNGWKRSAVVSKGEDYDSPLMDVTIEVTRWRDIVFLTDSLRHILEVSDAPAESRTADMFEEAFAPKDGIDAVTLSVVSDGETVDSVTLGKSKENAGLVAD